jgi:hypothetical protein
MSCALPAVPQLGNADRPAYHDGMKTRLHDLGLPMRTGRATALRQLVLQVPAPVAADALGVHSASTRQHMNTGAARAVCRK